MSARWCRLILALLAGVGFTALIALALNIPSPIALFISLLLLPGGLLASAFVPAPRLESPLLAFLFNACFYSITAYLLLNHWPRLELKKARSAVLLLAIPVPVLAWLACIPSISPLWPQGMSQLEEIEGKVRDGLH